MKLTVEDAKSWHVQEAAHYNGGDKFFAYLHRCVEQPRLSRFDRYDRKTKSVTSTWRTDGIDRSSFEAAIDALNTPPSFDADELAFLQTAPQEFTKKVAGAIDWAINDRVVNKGGVEWEKGCWRVTEAGRRALEAQEGE